MSRKQDSCPTCGSPVVPEDSPEGLCPRCLLLQGLRTGDEAEPSTVDAAPTLTLPSDDLEGQSIGPYRILETLGEGGLGIVFLAEQRTPIRRRVALKLIKVGMDSREVVARFESERQALALMNHPGIAGVLDAGTTRRGRPYFVMEYVPGLPLTEFCDGERLGQQERLVLFRSVCEAIQHAHHKGVIHRDIKPSNVLVARVDGEPMVKVIDFGVAKATVRPLTERTLFTSFGQLVGTPEYMSPEQVEVGNPDIDTRTDVYSLGVLLYELLVGVRPFDPEELRAAGFDEMRRKIREETPAKPSTRASTLGKELEELAGRRGTEATTLARKLRGDLDWIVMRALEKDRERRYGSPAELSRDIELFLSDRPVVARPPSPAYRMGKFLRRHRVLVSGLVFALLLVALGLTKYLVDLRDARWDAYWNRHVPELGKAEATDVGYFLAGTLGPHVRRQPGLLRDLSRGLLEIVDDPLHPYYPDRRRAHVAQYLIDGLLSHPDLYFLDEPRRLAPGTWDNRVEGRLLGVEPAEEQLPVAAEIAHTVAETLLELAVRGEDPYPWYDDLLLDRSAAAASRAAELGARAFGPDDPRVAESRRLGSRIDALRATGGVERGD